MIGSAANTALVLTERLARPYGPTGTTPFRSSEQALVLGDPLRQAPKSRDEFSEADPRTYSPELRGGLALHWFAAAPSVVSSDSALPQSAEQTVAQLGHGDAGVPAGMVVIPAHPWRARDLLERPAIRSLLDAGLLRDLGPGGPTWHPTSTLRTVRCPDNPFMLKLSMCPRITDSPFPFHRLGLPWDDPDETRALPAGLTRDREARPSLQEVLELRRDRMGTVRKLVDGVSDASLDEDTQPVQAPGWPESHSYRVRNLLLHVLREEWEHRLYAERDLDALTALRR